MTRAWTPYPMGTLPEPSILGATRGEDPELGPYWEQVTYVHTELDRFGPIRREVRLLRWYDRDCVTETVSRTTTKYR